MPIVHGLALADEQFDWNPVVKNLVAIRMAIDTRQ
jgi:hypothetical protein